MVYCSFLPGQITNLTDQKANLSMAACYFQLWGWGWGGGGGGIGKGVARARTCTHLDPSCMINVGGMHAMTIDT